MLSEPSGPGRGSSAPRVSESFGRDRRVLRRADYLETYSSGRRYVGRWLVLFVRPARGSCARLGVTITKKTGSAVVRNRLRRKLRELFRRSSALRAAVDVIVNVRAGAEETTYAELSRDFDKLVARAGAGGPP
jgi:ribonuclease P protein component